MTSSTFSPKTKHLCDFCHKEDFTFPCSGCKVYRYCTPKCQSLHFIDHEKDCKTSVNIGWTGKEYDSFTEDSNIRKFLCAFAYYIHMKRPSKVPTCKVMMKDGNFLASTGFTDRSGMAPKKEGMLEYILALGMTNRDNDAIFFNIVVVVDYKNCKMLYENKFKCILDVCEDEKIDIDVYDPPLNHGKIIKSLGAYKKGGKKNLFILS